MPILHQIELDNMRIPTNAEIKTANRRIVTNAMKRTGILIIMIDQLEIRKKTPIDNIMIKRGERLKFTF